MDLSFPQYSEEGRQLILRARDVAAEALKEKVRHDGSPFIGHPDAVARIVSDEIGLPAECVAAVYLHEGSRMGGLELNPREWDESIVTMVDGLNKISTINPRIRAWRRRITRSSSSSTPGIRGLPYSSSSTGWR